MLEFALKSYSLKSYSPLVWGQLQEVCSALMNINKETEIDVKNRISVCCYIFNLFFFLTGFGDFASCFFPIWCLNVDPNLQHRPPH